MRKVIAVLAAVFMSVAQLRAGEDRMCTASDFQLIATPEKPLFSKAEPVNFRLAVTNRKQQGVRIVPYLFPFDYWIEKYSGGQWKDIGGMVPGARFRQNLPLFPRDESEYRTLKSAETYSASFVVDPELLGKTKTGRFRIRVRAYAKETNDQNLRDIGCAMFTEFVPFSVK